MSDLTPIVRFLLDRTAMLPAVAVIAEMEREVNDDEVLPCFRIVYDFSCFNKLNRTERAKQEELCLTTLVETRKEAKKRFTHIEFEIDFVNRLAEPKNGYEYRKFGHHAARRADITEVWYDFWWSEKASKQAVII